MSVWLKISFLLLSILLSSCAATPDIHSRIPGTDLGINQPAELAMRLAVSPKNSQVAVGSVKHISNLWDISTGQKLKTFKMSSSVVGCAAWVVVQFMPDGKKIIVRDLGIKIVDIETGNIIREFSETSLDFAVSPDGKFILMGGPNHELAVLDLGTGHIRKLKGHADSGWRGAIYSVDISPDGRLALSGSWDATARLWDVSTGEILKIFKGHSEGYRSSFDPGVYVVRFTPDNRYALTVGDASLRIWDITTGREVAMMVSFEDGEWLTITSEGYYNASPNGHSYMSLITEGKTYGMEQFYDVFFRPDIVAAKLRGEDIGGLVTITMQDAIKMPPPVVEFTRTPATTDAPRAQVCYQVKNGGGGIGEVRLFHNGKLIDSDGYYREAAKTPSGKAPIVALNSKAIYDDMRSVSVKGTVENAPTTSKAKADVFEECKEVDAVPGENEVSVTAFNGANTVQGTMKTTRFTSNIQAENPHLYILSIGINEYKDKSVTLKYAVKDAEDIKEKVLKQAATIYRPEYIHDELLTDANAAKRNILSRIQDLTKRVKPTDSVILFVAGHGILLQNQYYLLTHDFDGAMQAQSMISSNEIVEMSKKIKSLSQLFIFDTCHAGGVDYIVSGLYDARISVLAKKMGLHIYASANDRQAAMDGYKGNGLFTHTLLQGLNNNKATDKDGDGKVSVVELGGFSKQTTTDISRKTGQHQTPLIINFGKDNVLYKLN